MAQENTVYENFVLESKLNDLLDTQLDMNQFLTIDRSLTENPGMKKIVNTYTFVGAVEDLAMKIGNTGYCDLDYASSEYEVGVTQTRFRYFDEQFWQDPLIVDYALKGMADAMTNDLTAKAITEFEKATLTQEGNFDFDHVVDALAKYPYEDESGLFLLINPAQLADFRKNLGDSLQYSEGFARTGYIVTVCGVPVYVSKAVTDGTGILAHRSAVKCFVKKGSEIEQTRIANSRQNDIYCRKVMLVALVDATRVVLLTEEGGTSI